LASKGGARDESPSKRSASKYIIHESDIISQSEPPERREPVAEEASSFLQKRVGPLYSGFDFSYFGVQNKREEGAFQTQASRILLGAGQMASQSEISMLNVLN